MAYPAPCKAAYSGRVNPIKPINSLSWTFVSSNLPTILGAKLSDAPPSNTASVRPPQNGIDLPDIDSISAFPANIIKSPHERELPYLSLIGCSCKIISSIPTLTSHARCGSNRILAPLQGPSNDPSRLSLHPSLKLRESELSRSFWTETSLKEN